MSYIDNELWDYSYTNKIPTDIILKQSWDTILSYAVDKSKIKLLDELELKVSPTIQKNIYQNAFFMGTHGKKFKLCLLSKIEPLTQDDWNLGIYKLLNYSSLNPKKIKFIFDIYIEKWGLEAAKEKAKHFAYTTCSRYINNEDFKNIIEENRHLFDDEQLFSSIIFAKSHQEINNNTFNSKILEYLFEKQFKKENSNKVELLTSIIKHGNPELLEKILHNKLYSDFMNDLLQAMLERETEDNVLKKTFLKYINYYQGIQNVSMFSTLHKNGLFNDSEIITCFLSNNNSSLYQYSLENHYDLIRDYALNTLYLKKFDFNTLKSIYEKDQSNISNHENNLHFISNYLKHLNKDIMSENEIIEHLIFIKDLFPIIEQYYSSNKEIARLLLLSKLKIDDTISLHVNHKKLKL